MEKKNYSAKEIGRYLDNAVAYKVSYENILDDKVPVWHIKGTKELLKNVREIPLEIRENTLHTIFKDNCLDFCEEKLNTLEKKLNSSQE